MGEDEDLDDIDETHSSTMKFLMTYGWAIVIVLVAIGALAYFGVFGQKEYNLTNPDYVCSNTEIVYKGNLHIYPTVLQQRQNMNTDNEFVFMVDTENNDVLMSDDLGVMCQVPIMMCNYGMDYCMDMYMLVPINYTEYDQWVTQIKS